MTPELLAEKPIEKLIKEPNKEPNKKSVEDLLGSVSLNLAEPDALVSPEADLNTLELDKTELATMSRYLLADNMISEINGAGFSVYIDKTDLMHQITETTETGETISHPVFRITKDSPLESIYLKANERREKLEKPEYPLDYGEVCQLIYDLKINHILDMGDVMKEYLDNKEVVNLGQAKAKIRAWFSTTYEGIGPVLEKTGKYNDENRQKLINGLENLFNGMRHESAFDEFISEGNSSEKGNLFEIEETSPHEETRGVDMAIRAKLLLDEDGKYHFPATEDEFEQANLTTLVYVDIKASEDAVEKALNRRDKKKLTGKKGLSLIMWSHVYNDDFRLGLSGDMPTLKYTKDEASLYFKFSDNKDGQLDLMKRLDEVPDLKYRNSSGTLIHPDDFETRYSDMKKMLIDYINDGNTKIESINNSIA